MADRSSHRQRAGGSNGATALFRGQGVATSPQVGAGDDPGQDAQPLPYLLPLLGRVIGYIPLCWRIGGNLLAPSPGGLIPSARLLPVPVPLIGFRHVPPFGAALPLEPPPGPSPSFPSARSLRRASSVGSWISLGSTLAAGDGGPPAALLESGLTMVMAFPPCLSLAEGLAETLRRRQRV